MLRIVADLLRKLGRLKPLYAQMENAYNFSLMNVIVSDINNFTLNLRGIYVILHWEA